MKKLSQCAVCLVFVLFVFFAYPTGTKTSPIDATPGPHIEVCSNGIVYVPAGTRFVTCRGRVMEVIAIVSLAEGTEAAGGCQCPLCCGGLCTVTVRCGMPGGLCVMYLAC